MKRCILIIFIISIDLVYSQNIEYQSTKFDTIVTRKMDVTNDSIEEYILIELSAKNKQEPYFADLYIFNQDDVCLYYYQSFDNDIQSMFSKEYFPDCETIAEAKMKYYITDFMGFQTTKYIDFVDPEILFDETNEKGLKIFTKKCLLKINPTLSVKDVDKIITQLENGLKNKNVIIITHKISITEIS
ncbi:MAG: hypothetical protein P8078_06780, partial [bacterium]